MNFLTLSLKSLIFLWKLNDFLKMIVQIFDFPLKNRWFFKEYRANLWFSFEKQMNFSPGCVMQVCVADRLQIPPNDHLDTVGSQNAFASKGYVLKMSLSERPSFSRNWKFEIWDFLGVRAQEINLTWKWGAGLTHPLFALWENKHDVVLLDLCGILRSGRL